MILSLHPRHAQNVLEGLKVTELRRTRPLVQMGQQVAVYATSPVSAIVGAVTVASVSSMPLDSLKESHLERALIADSDFDAYFSGCSKGVAIGLTEPSRLENPAYLSDIREAIAWNPPQTWHFWPLSLVERLSGAIPALGVLRDRITASSDRVSSGVVSG